MSLLGTRTQLSAIGLDIDAHEFRAVQLVQSGDVISTLAWAVFPRQDEFNTADGIPAAEELKWAASILGRRGFVGRRISIVPSTGSCSSHVMELPPADSGAPIGQLARMEIARERKCGPDEFELGHWKLPAKGRTQETLAVACPRTVISSAIERFEEAGLVPVGIGLLELAVCRGGAAGFDEQVVDNEINASLHIGWTSTLAVLTLGDTVIYVRRIERGASSVWDMITGRYRLAGKSANAVMDETAGTEASEAMNKIRRAVWYGFALELANELDVAVAYVSHSYRMAPLGKVRLSGYGACNSVIIEHIDQVIGIPIVSNAPSAVRQSMGTLQENLPLACRLTVAYGLAERFDQ